MEETLHVEQSTEILVPPSKAQDPLPPTDPVPPRKTTTKKRKLSDAGVHNAAYFKILALVQQVRPHFIEALQTPDFRNCKAAYEIRKRMKLMMDFYKQMQLEGNPTEKQENKSERRHLSGVREHKKKQYKHVLKKSAEMELPAGPVSPGEKFDNGRRPKGSYIVGGSVSGYNFMTFVNRKPPVYYGITKESYRRGHSRSEKGDLCLGMKS